MKCSICGRKLRNPKSRELGYGPVCYKKAFRAVKTEKNMDGKKAFSAEKYSACEKVVRFLSVDNDESVIDDISEVTKYRLIGTVEECQEAMGKQKAKKPTKDEYNHSCCPNCGWIVYKDEYGGRYLPCCENCGQAIDWYDRGE